MLRSLAAGSLILLLQSVHPVVQQGFDLVAPYTPRPHRVDGHSVVRYELHLTNFARDARDIDRIEVIDPATQEVLASLEGDALSGAIGGPGRDAGATLVGSGDRAVVYVDLRLPDGKSIPKAFAHTVVSGSATVTGGNITVDFTPLPTVGPPLRGGQWAAAYEPSLQRGHRRVIYSVEGSACIPGRHAIDWFSAEPGDGRGADVVAVSDGVVAAVRDDMDEPPAGTVRPPVSLADATGNLIALRLSDGNFAIYEHLAKGVLVRVGDRVRRGQIIARVGATGQASRPHLHFHVASGISNLGSEGIPFRQEGAMVVGRYANVMDASSGGEWTPQMPRSLRELSSDVPAPNVVVRF